MKNSLVIVGTLAALGIAAGAFLYMRHSPGTPRPAVGQLPAPGLGVLNQLLPNLAPPGGFVAPQTVDQWATAGLSIGGSLLSALTNSSGDDDGSYFDF